MGLAVDELGERLGIDPLEIAVRNFSHEWEETPNASLHAVLSAGARRIGWKRRAAPSTAAPDYDGKLRGLGFSFHHAWHAAWQEEARGRVQVGITLNPDGSVVLDAPQAETGTGSNTCAVVSYAEAMAPFGVTPEDVEWVARVDTATGLKDMVQTDSAVAYLHAEVMHLAAADIRTQLRRAAAAVLGVDAAAVDLRDGLVLVDGAETGTSVKDVLRAPDMLPLRAMATEMPPLQRTGAPYLATFAEVAVDPETGKVDVERLIVVHDAGAGDVPDRRRGAADRRPGAGRGRGAVPGGRVRRPDGQALSFDWVDYTMPTMLDMPQVEPVLLEVWKGAGTYGACGVGESGHTPARHAPSSTPSTTPPACASTRSPAKPERVLEALARKREGRPGLDEELTASVRSRLAAADRLRASSGTCSGESTSAFPAAEVGP